MNSVGKILLGIVVLFLGITIFNYANSYSLHRDIYEQGDEAIKNDDLTVFINRFEYYKEEPLVDEKITVNDDVSFNLHIYQQANTKQGTVNYLTVLVTNLTIEDRKDELKLQIDYKATKRKDDEYVSLVSIGEENWYLQWIGLLFDEIESISIYHEDLLLYKSEEGKPFLRVEDYDMANFIKGKSFYNGVITHLGEDLEYVDIPDRGLELDQEKLHEIDFSFKVSGIEDLGDLYLEGHFNGFQTNHENYKITKSKDGIYREKFNFTSKYEKLIFTLVTEDGKVVTDKEGNVVYFTYEYLDTENFDYNDYGIKESIKVSFNKYSYIKWVVLAIYAGIMILGIVLVNYVRSNKQQKNQPIYTNQEQAEVIEAEVKEEVIEEKKE